MHTALNIHEHAGGFDSACAQTCVPDPVRAARFHAAMKAVAGKWKIQILCVLLEQPHRFGALKRALPGITAHMLSTRLHELEACGLVLRTAAAGTRVAQVDYRLTDAAADLLPMFRALRDWSDRHGALLGAAMPTAG